MDVFRMEGNVARHRSTSSAGRRGESAKKAKNDKGVYYRDKKSGRFVAESTWKRSRARGGTRYFRQRLKVPRSNGRELNVLGFDGYVPRVVRSSKPAKLASGHLIAVGRFLRTGDTELLKPFVGKRVGSVELLTDPDRLRELADADLVKLDALYRNQRGQGRRK
jgi:hypothetical protein